MSRGLFRLVGVWSGCWVVRDEFCWNNNCVIINMHGKTTIKKNNNKLLVRRRHNSGYTQTGGEYSVNCSLCVWGLWGGGAPRGGGGGGGGGGGRGGGGGGGGWWW
jgi:hypothetical protein